MIKKILLKIRYFLWILSGSDLKILKKSPTDHNRHANVGLAILVTTIIAFCTGALAGYEFGNQTITSAILFGLIWSLLVFTIDRTMVLTLKKNPTLTTKQRLKKLIIPIIYRVFLSALISFFIAIPLELWLFRENIKVQLDIDKSEQILDKQKREESTYRISSIEASIKNINTEAEEINNLLTQAEPPNNFKNYGLKKQEMLDAKSSYDLFYKNHSNKVAQRKVIYADVPRYYANSDTLRLNLLRDKSSNAYKKWLPIWLETKPKDGTLTIQLQNKKEEYDKVKAEVKKIVSDYFKSITVEKQRIDSLKTQTQNSLTKNKSDVNKNTDEFTNLINSQEGFTTKWKAINNIEDFWIIFFIWFIRLVFFTIELLPTMAKVSTPIGSYDWGIYRAERRRKKFLKKIEVIKIKGLEQIENQRLKTELKTQKKILKKLAKKQQQIATNILDEWEKIQKIKSKADLDKFSN